MPRLLTIFLVVLLALPAHATLVAVVPARNGVVVAADSRFTFMGAPCDNALKILEPVRPARTVAIVTGDSIFVAPPPAGENPCPYLARAPRLLDMGAVVTAYLDANGSDPAQISISNLAAACVHAVERFQRTYPSALRGYVGKEIFSVVAVSYDPVHRASTLRNFVVRIDAGSGSVQAARIRETGIGPSTPSGVWLFGKADYVNREIYSGPGRRFLSPPTLDFLEAHKPAGNVSMDRAEGVAADVVRAAIRTSEIDPPHSAIGGQIRVVVVDAELHPHAAP